MQTYATYFAEDAATKLEKTEGVANEWREKASGLQSQLSDVSSRLLESEKRAETLKQVNAMLFKRFSHVNSVLLDQAALDHLATILPAQGTTKAKSISSTSRAVNGARPRSAGAKMTVATTNRKSTAIGTRSGSQHYTRARAHTDNDGAFYALRCG